jgi:excisionase family DNA binding protein
MHMTQEHSRDWRERSTLTVEEAGAILGIGRASAYTAAGTGDLPVIRIGRRVLVPVGQLRRLLGETDDPTNTTGPATNPDPPQNSGRQLPHDEAYRP